MSNTEELSNYGFRLIGFWELNNSFKSVPAMAHLQGINFAVSNPMDLNESRVTYAFIFRDQIGYIGSTRQQINYRLSQYRRGFSDNSKIDKGKNDTDNRVKESITKELEKNGTVSIWIASPKAKLCLFDGTEVEIDAYESLEKYLINKLKPLVNRM
jgi:hypothetical protein